mmetsp:Transcript_1783/g.4904  ORF Transcript_1783/g.4904 Transcript_1783/m.4904 type:complete len:214 (-) Transcript_1783:618-1259(-)
MRQRHGTLQSDLCVAFVLVDGILVRTGVLQPRNSSQQALACRTKCFNLNVPGSNRCLEELDSHVAFLKAPQGRLFHLRGGRRKCSQFTTRQLGGGTCNVCASISLIKCSTGVGHLRTHPLTNASGGTQLVLQSHDTGFSLCMKMHSKQVRNTTLELLSKILGLICLSVLPVCRLVLQFCLSGHLSRPLAGIVICLGFLPVLQSLRCLGSVRVS